MASKKELILIIDGTDLGKSCGALLVSLALGKRSLPLVWLVKKGNKGHFSVDEHLTLLAQVSCLLPASASVTVLGDGEFDSCQLQEFIKNKGRNYILRIAKNTYIEDAKGDMYQLKELSPDPKMGYLWIENCSFTRRKYGLVSCLIWQHPTEQEPIYLVFNLSFLKKP